MDTRDRNLAETLRARDRIHEEEEAKRRGAHAAV